MKSTPSQAAKSNQYLKSQRGSSRILDCRRPLPRSTDTGPFSDTVAPPIQLFNPAFAYFTSKAFDPEHVVPDDFIRHIRCLVEAFAFIHPAEANRRNCLANIITETIGRPTIIYQNADGTSPDGLVLGSRGLTAHTYLVVFEEKREFGDGGSDPSTQGAFSFLRIFCQDLVGPLIIMRSFPLILDCIGPCYSSNDLLPCFHCCPCWPLAFDSRGRNNYKVYRPATHRLSLDSNSLYP